MEGEFSQVLSKQELVPLMKRRNGPGAALTAIHFSIYLTALLGVIVSVRIHSIFLVCVSSIAFSVVVASLFGPLHECGHATAFKNRRLGDVVGVIIPMLGLFIPYFYYREYHFEHHRKAHVPGDPEGIRDFPTTIRGVLVFYLKLLFIHSLRLRVLWMSACFGKNIHFVPQKKRTLVITEAWLLTGWIFAVAITFARSSTLAFTIFIGVQMLSGFILQMHTFCEHSALGTEGTIFDRTRTMYSNVLWRMLMWNETYHAEHHAYPAVPFYSLPKLHVALKPHLVHLEKGYLSVHRKLIAGTRERNT